MYRSLTADDFRKKFGLEPDYKVSGFIVFGNYKEFPYQSLKDSLKRLGYKASFSYFRDDFLKTILEFRVNDKIYWFSVVYGGTLLSEYLHLACLFGSQTNILLGSCGGLKNNALSGDVIVPTWSYADDSSAKAYQPTARHRYKSDETLSKRIADKLSTGHNVYREPMITYQAMLAETWEDVQSWSKQGYAGVEMEAATVFAASNHFNVPAAAILIIADNLIAGETVMDPNYQNIKEARKTILDDAFDIAVKEVLSK